MNIEECALKLMQEMAADRAKGDPRWMRLRNPYEFIGLSVEIEGMVQQGGKIETARWIWVDRGSLTHPVCIVRIIMDADDPEDVDVTEREAESVG